MGRPAPHGDSLQRLASLLAPGLLAQPLRIGAGFIGAGFDTAGQGVGEHERGGGLEFAAEQIGGAAPSNPSDHQSWPRVRTSVSSASHRGCWLSPAVGSAISRRGDENWLMRRLLVTRLQPAGSPLSWLRGLTGKDHFCQDSIRPRARPATSKIPGLPPKDLTSRPPPRTFTDNPGRCGCRR